METIKNSFVKAKKEHKCDFCNRTIKIGDIYHYSFSVDGGDSWSSRECVYCDFIIPYVINFNGFIDGALPYEISDCIFEKGIELKLVNKLEKQTFELLQRLSHDIAFHYGFGKKKLKESD